ncbi:sulfurtransferase TusA family protein [Thalassomonas haliotis]|uniref:Sulfurtransferase TusA family protein n=1 Tax=Thalassomonas haliotis TaxID=485448 RepID=A0ABY7V910_9GAMM|nr:sulfurtransferase TusA family protein [Thalassomonas haliotis]WDE10046.1 sulfurtransferase TusA family protein [Thalassomonas haliotis]
MLYEYDATADKCPLPLVKMRVILKKMQKDDVCLIRISDKGSIKDIPKLLKKQGYPYNVRYISNSVLELHIKNR